MNIKILTYPDPRLRKKTKPITKIDDTIRRLTRQMLDVMYKEGGVGLAAIQVGKPIRLIVINLTKKPSDEIVLINPKIVKKMGKIQETEGCLSLPGIKASVPRYKNIVCRTLNLEGKELYIDTNSKESEAGQLLSRVIQHELDHLEGILFIDYLSDADRKPLTHQLKDLEAKY